MKITAFFTDGGTPATGLSATIDGWEVAGAQVITAQAMIEQAAGWYYYEFAGYDETKDYVFRCDGSATLSGYDRYTFGVNRDDLEMSGKLPTNYFMGSSIAGDKDDEIDEILVDTGTTLPASLTTIITEIDANETKIDSIISDTDRLRYRGSVWLDDTAANTNTVLGTDGVPENPVSTIAAALTIATALNVQSLVLMNNTSVSLSQSFADWVIEGHGYNNIVTLNTQSVDNAMICNCQVTGTQAGTGSVLLEHCYLDSIVNLRCTAFYCLLIGNITIVAANNIFFNHCSSAVAGNNTPILTFSATATSVSFRGYSGGLDIRLMTVDHTMSLETDGQIIINANCTGGALTIRGNMSITDNSGGAVTITQDAALNRSVLAPISEYDTELDATISSRAPASEYDTELATIQADLDSPNQYKADVSALSTEANATTNTTNIQTNIDANETKIDTLQSDVTLIKTKTDNLPTNTSTDIQKLLGIADENSYIDTYTKDGSDRMTGCRKRIYDSKANAVSHGATGLLATYQVTVTYSGADFGTYLMTLE